MSRELQCALGLALVVLPGCWPYIAGSWADNAPARATAAVIWDEFEGAGWEDNTPGGTAHWGLFQTPQDDFAADWVLPAPAGCSDHPVDLSAWTDRLVDLPENTSVISTGNADVPLSWNAAGRRYDVTLLNGDVGLDATSFNLEETALVSGSLAVSPFVLVPGAIPYYGPDPGDEDDARIPDIALNQLQVTWSGSAADLIAVSGTLLDGDGNGLEHWTCAAAAEAGEVGIPEDQWDDANVGAADRVIFGVLHIVYTNTAISGLDAVSRGVGSRGKYAVYTVNP
ncbi:MAG: hypothetical protein EXR69_10860 [Myxococcales bacterium]|nr:hypothetical protein [Myxococcales bacterium]